MYSVVLFIPNSNRVIRRFRFTSLRKAYRSFSRWLKVSSIDIHLFSYNVGDTLICRIDGYVFRRVLPFHE